MTKIIFNKSHKIIAAVMALVLCFSAFLWIAPQVQAEELDISDTSVTGFTTPGTPPHDHERQPYGRQYRRVRDVHNR